MILRLLVCALVLLLSSCAGPARRTVDDGAQPLREAETGTGTDLGGDTAPAPPASRDLGSGADTEPLGPKPVPPR